MFRITGNRGFHIVFENRWTISVQFGAGNYCFNYNEPFRYAKELEGVHCENAEIAILNPEHELFAHPDFEGDTVKGYITPDELVKYILWTANQDKEKLT